MVTPDRFHQLILGVLTPYTKIEYANRDAEIHNELIVDQDRGHYLVMSTGWARDPLKRRIHGSLIHLAGIDEKIWVQRDGTEDGVAGELEEVGISKQQIVLGFQEPGARQYTDYAAA